jgi:phosphatidylinositol alpha-1,6-mannosyltransferase
VRYLLLTPDFPPREGGIQTLLAVVAGELSGRSDVTVVTPAADGDAAYDAGRRYVVRRYRRGRSRVLNALRLGRAAFHLAREHDVLFCGHVAAAPVAWALGSLFGKPYIVYVHALEITPARYRFLFSFLLRRAAAIVVGSRYARDLVVSYLGITPDHIDLVPPAVDPALVEAATDSRPSYRYKKRGERVLLSVGRLDAGERYKGHDVVIWAMQYILKCVPRAYYWVVGAGDDVGRLKAVAGEAGVADHVKFWGRVEDVVPFYRESDLFVMVSRCVREDKVEKGEGFGLVFLEASLFAKPVLAGQCGGALDAVLNGETGVLINPNDPAEVAAAAVALLTSPAEAKRLGAAGRERVLRDFTAARQAERLETLAAARLAERGQVTSL